MSMGSQACDRTSQKRNRRIPTAVAFRTTRRLGAGLRHRPSGIPSTMVPPAVTPSSKVVEKLPLIASHEGKATLKSRWASASAAAERKLTETAASAGATQVRAQHGTTRPRTALGGVMALSPGEEQTF